MRILLVSDLHYSLPQLDWVIGQGPEFDLVVVAGDTLSIRSPVPLEAQSVIALEYLSRLQSVTNVAVTSGNHDLTGPDAHDEQSALWLEEARAAGIPTDGDSLAVGDVLVTLCPWWDGPAGRARVADQLAGDAARRPAYWVWVYHWPPIGSPTCWTGRKDYGDEDLAEWIAEHRPDLVLTGHVHESPFKPDGNWVDRVGRTWVLNAGNQIGPVPAHIVLDLAAQRATWSSMLGTEAVDLAGSIAPARSVF